MPKPRIVLHVELDQETHSVAYSIPQDRLLAYGMIGLAFEGLLRQGLAAAQQKPLIQVPTLVPPGDLRG